MTIHCPHCLFYISSADNRMQSKIIKFGQYRRSSDKKIIQRFKCRICSKSFSKATTDSCYKQIKRQFNQTIFEHLASGVSQRRLAYLLRLNRKTIKRKFIFLGLKAIDQLQAHNLKKPKTSYAEFDDLETFEHTKCKPLSITLAVEGETRRILGFSVSRMPAKGLLTRISLKKYGPRKDERAQGRERLFCNLKYLIEENAVIKSDQNPHYPMTVKNFFPKALHLTTKGRRGAITGQGELKKINFDPIFSLNHTCAKLRADVNRLIRKTWCTTKRPDRLELHLSIAALYHNQQLLLPKRV